MPMQHTVILWRLGLTDDVFSYFAQNIDCGYTLEPPFSFSFPCHFLKFCQIEYVCIYVAVCDFVLK